MRRHRFGHNGHFLDIISPIRRVSEHLGRVDIADYIIYIPVVHNNFGNARLHKHTLQILERGRHIHRHHFRTGHDAIAYLDIGEIKRILKECVDTEDKEKPYTDDELAETLKTKGYPIARRTVAKYRQQLNIPVARLRR